MLQDLRQALRTLATRPGFTTAAIVSLALGIGAETSVYALIRALFDRPPMGVAEPHEIVAISALEKGKPVEDAIRFPDYVYLRDHNTVFSALASHFNSGVGLFDSERGEAVNGHVVSAEYFSVLGLTPRLGRFFLAEEDRVPGRDAVVVLSHSYWQRRFDGDARLGQTLKLNGVPFTVIGVAPAGFEGAKISWPGDVFIPNMMARVAARDVDVRSRNSARLDLLGRLMPGRRLADARAEMSMLARQLEATFPETNHDSGVLVSDLNGIHPQARTAGARLPRLLLAAVTCLLVIACVNLSGLLMVRHTARRREIAIRLAIGAGRLRIIRQLMTESFLLSLAGGMAGLLIALLGNRMLQRYYGVQIDGVQHLYTLALDWPAFAVSLSLVIVTGLAFGLLPALQISNPALVPAIKGNAAVQGFRRSRLRNVFLVAQVGLSAVLLVCAGLLIRSVRTLRWDPGFDAQKTVYFRMRPLLGGYDEAAARAYFENVRRRLESLAEVESVAFARWPPALTAGSVPVSLPAVASGESGGTLRVGQNIVTPGFFETLHIRLVRGRGFEDRDRRGNLTSAVVNQALADRLWPDREPVGETLLVNGQPHLVIGVAAYRNLDLGEAPAPFLFRVGSSVDLAAGRALVRVKSDPARVVSLLREQILAVDPSVAVVEGLPLTRLVENLHAEVPLALRVASFAGGLALLLSAIGLYSGLAMWVSQRTREIGIRIALGAQTSSVVALVLRQGMTPALLGLGVGLFAAVNVSKLVSSLLFGVAPGDPVTFLVAATLLAGVSLAACSVPAWRATRVEPTRALRQYT